MAGGVMSLAVGAALFARWGIPTAESVVICRKEFPNLTVIASGGMRTGIEVAKAIALGADAAALALPILKAAEKSTDDAVRLLDEHGRRIASLTPGVRVASLTDI